MTQHTKYRSSHIRAAGVGWILIVGLTLASGGLAGWLGNRWGLPVDLLSAGKNLERVPAEFGDWLLESAEPLNTDTVEMLQCTGSTHRVYRNRTTGEAVTMALIVGPPGPTSVHTPEICYSSLDYRTISAPKRFRVPKRGSADSVFWGMVLEAASLEGGKLSVAYAWNDEHGWVAVDRPRYKFGGAKLLYKLQLAAVVNGDSAPDQKDPCREFLRDFLPALDAVLFNSELTKQV